MKCWFCSEVAPYYSCSLDELFDSVKKTNVCIKGILQTPPGKGGKKEEQSVNVAIR